PPAAALRAPRRWPGSPLASAALAPRHARNASSSPRSTAPCSRRARPDGPWLPSTSSAPAPRLRAARPRDARPAAAPSRVRGRKAAGPGAAPRPAARGGAGRRPRSPRTPRTANPPVDGPPRPGIWRKPPWPVALPTSCREIPVRRPPASPQPMRSSRFSTRRRGRVPAVNDLPARMLSRIVSWRIPILVAYALLVPLAAVRAARIPSEGGLDRLIVPSDPDFAATRAFQRLFPDSPSVLLFFESDDPWAPGSLARIEAAERELRAVPRVGAFSVLDAIRRARPGAGPDELRRLATGTQFFRKQGLLGDRFLSVIANLDVHGPRERDDALAAIDAVLARSGAGLVHRVGAPYVDSWLEQQSGAASARYFPFFGALVVGVALLLYRSVRTLLAFMLSLASAVALGVAAGGLLGFTFTIVSVLVPLTVLVTTLASLVYLHSRFVDRPAGVPVRE